MAIHRAVKDTNFTVMSNCHLRDRHLSLKAKGLLSLMLSLPPEWGYSLHGLAAISKEGKDSILSALRELEREGYLLRAQRIDSAGKFLGNDYTIWEKPHCDGISPHRPLAENPSPENPPVINKEEINQLWGCDEWI